MTLSNKVYILDTNVLAFDSQAIFNFEDGVVAIPIFVLEELDKFKSETSERAYNARTVIRSLDQLRSKGSLQSGVDLDNGSKLKIVFICDECEAKNFALEQNIVDNKILLLANCLLKKGFDVKFVTKDINARVKADVLGIDSQDYLKNSVTKENLYRGWIRVSVPAIELKRDLPEELLRLEAENLLTVNQFVILESQHNPFNYVVYRYLGQDKPAKFKVVKAPNLNLPLEPKNVEQLMALDLLLDDSIKLVTLLGPAGTGKTFLTLLAGLDKVLIKSEYEKILVTRPVIPLGPDIGYLPGDIQEKLLSWMQPVYDNMDFIAHSLNARYSSIYKEEEPYQGFGTGNVGNNNKRRRHGKDKSKTTNIFPKRVPPLEVLLRENKISLEAITYMRGRSIPYQYILIDEVQNLTPHEVKTLITRVGQGSKIILAGDPYQIDSLYLDFMSNGLVVTTNKFKGHSIFGSVYLQISERSELSRLAGELL